LGGVSDLPLQLDLHIGVLCDPWGAIILGGVLHIWV
jgi:hypothetical protein